MTTTGRFDPVLPVAVEELASTGSYVDAVHQLLAVVRTQLRMSVAWVSEFVGSDQVLRYVDAAPGKDAPQEGTRLPLGGSFCARVLDGRFPALIPDARGVPETALLDVTADLHIGAYVGVPLLGPQGLVVGMLCAINDTYCPSMDERDVAVLRMLAEVLHDLQRRAQDEGRVVADRERARNVIGAVISGAGRHPVLQPVVDLSTGQVVCAEGLTRFTATSPVGAQRSAAQWFDDAGRLGLGPQLELATAAAVLDLLADVPEAVRVTINLAPAALLGDGLAQLLEGRPLDRVVVEITEHAPVDDYDALAAALQPYRDQGLRLAVDDAGAGYASLRHVLSVRPEMVKVDMALVRGIDGDLARRTLLTALAGFAAATGSSLVAEGVETSAELQAVRSCGVPLAQGYHLAPPSPEPSWAAYPV